MTRALLALLVIGVASAGCKRSIQEAFEKGQEQSIVRKTTGEIGKFDPSAGARVSDSTIDENRLATPLVGPLAAYGPMVEQISKLYIEQAINFFYAEHGRYPKSYDEFMEKIIRANHIELPVLPGNAKYQYDVENHKLVVIEAPPDAEKKD